VSLNGSATDNDPTFPSGAIFYWTFVYSGNVQNLSGPNASFTFVAPGTYAVTLNVRDAWGNIGSDSRIVVVRPPDTVPPIVQPITDKTINVGTVLHITAQASDNSADFATTGNYTWTFRYNNATVTLYGASFDFLFELHGDYTVTLVVMDGTGNAAAARTFVVRVIIPDVTAPVIGGAAVDKATINAGETVHFSASATDNGADLTDTSAFVWTFTYNGSTRTLTGPTPAFRFDVAGTYTVTLKVSDGAGNNATRAVTVTVNENPSTVTTPPGPGLEVLALILVVVAVGGIIYFIGRRRKPQGKAAGKAPDNTEESEK